MKGISSEAPSIEYMRPLSQAWGRMIQALFRPFDLHKWFVLGFTAFLAQLTDGSNGAGGDEWGGGHEDFDILHRNVR